MHRPVMDWNKLPLPLQNSLIKFIKASLKLYTTPPKWTPFLDLDFLASFSPAYLGFGCFCILTEKNTPDISFQNVLLRLHPESWSFSRNAGFDKRSKLLHKMLLPAPLPLQRAATTETPNPADHNRAASFHTRLKAHVPSVPCSTKRGFFSLLQVSMEMHQSLI